MIYLLLYSSERGPDNSFDSIQPKGYIGLETSVRDSSSLFKKFLSAYPNRGLLLITYLYLSTSQAELLALRAKTSLM